MGISENFLQAHHIICCEPSLEASELRQLAHYEGLGGFGCVPKGRITTKGWEHFGTKGGNMMKYEGEVLDLGLKLGCEADKMTKSRCLGGG